MYMFCKSGNESAFLNHFKLFSASAVEYTTAFLCQEFALKNSEFLQTSSSVCEVSKTTRLFTLQNFGCNL